MVSIGHSSHLESGQKADSVVSVFGSSTSDGEAVDVVSVIGNTRVTGPVGDTAVAVMGNAYVDAKVNGDVVAVLGNVELGPHAEVGGDVVAVLGRVDRDPAAIVHGSVQRIIDWDIGGATGFSGLNIWITHCLLLGRPLAFTAGLGWAWTLALCLLAFYACLALMFRDGIDQCVHTLESQPGHTALAALLGILLTPVLLILLCVTVIGIAAVPFVVAALVLHVAVRQGRHAGMARRPHFGPQTRARRPSRRRGAHRRRGRAGAVRRAGRGVPGLQAAGLLWIRRRALHLGAARARAPSRRQSTAGIRGRQSGTAPNSPPPNNAAAMAGPGWTAGAAPAAAASAPPPRPQPLGTPPRSRSHRDRRLLHRRLLRRPRQPASVSPQITAAMPRAGFWVRMGALFLDIILVGFATSLLHPFGDGHMWGDFHIVVLAIYGAVMWKLRGTTVGGIVFDLHVVRVDGRPVDWETAIVRALGCFLSLCVVFLGFIWIAFDANHQAWHDKIAGTVVVRAKRSGL